MQVTGLDVAGVNGLRLFITAHPRDDTLTTAFHSPSVLAGAQEGSLADYAFLDNDLEFGRPPRNALVISTVPDHGARNVVRSLAMLLSFGLGIGLNFV